MLVLLVCIFLCLISLIGLLVVIMAVWWSSIQPYRLGDYVRRRGGFEHSLQGTLCFLIYGKMQHKNSIVRKYGDSTRQAVNVQVLADSVVKRQIRNALPQYDIVFHLRLGDVIDNHKRSVDDFISGMYDAQYTEGLSVSATNTKQWKGSECTHDSCDSEGYVKPFQYFDSIIQDIPYNQRDVVLVSGSHTHTKNPAKSQEYLTRLREWLETKHGVQVRVRWNENPDDDFVVMSTAKYLVTTGGGFSALAALCARHLGGTVVA